MKGHISLSLGALKLKDQLHLPPLVLGGFSEINFLSPRKGHHSLSLGRKRQRAVGWGGSFPNLMRLIFLELSSYMCLYNVLDFPAGTVPVSTMTEEDEAELQQHFCDSEEILQVSP